MTKKKTNEPASGVFNITESDIEKFDRMERERARLKHQELKREAELIEDLRERRDFWSKAQNEYRHSIHDMELPLHASGVVSAKFGGMKLWLDMRIQIELDDLLNQIQNLPPDSVDSKRGVKEVILLYELGVIEFLYKRFGTNSPSTLHYILPEFVNIEKTNAKQVLQRLAGKGQGSEYKPEQHRYAQQTIHRQCGEMKPLHLITFDPKK
ncbi:MAG: hypothetical protein ACK5U7_02015 [Bacteroidota bacterium]|jgi:hypothetical protein